MSEIHKILEKHWGFKTFRPLQEEIIHSVLKGQDTLALLPTGGGKSVCFQIPALAKEGICIVVSPLIALMKDQVQNLKKHGINAAAIYSGLKKRSIDIILDNCIYGDVRFLYVSPERLKTELFQERLKKMNVSLIAVDEAHCISQWGYDFRPAYLEITEIRKFVPDVPCIALTASATNLVCEDIIDKLQLEKPAFFRKSFARKNLSYSSFYSENKKKKILEIINAVPGTGVIYVRNRDKTKSIANYLRQQEISADYYHAGLRSEDRSKKQDEWISGKTRIIVSTNAFGMGIDKPDVRFVIHLDIPPDLESYYQEAGRGGRDEKKAYAVLLYNDSDIESLKNSVEEKHPPVKKIKETYHLLTEFYRLAEGSSTEEFLPFDLHRFCTKYKLNESITHNCIRILHNQELIETTEELNSYSRVQINANPKDYLNKQHSGNSLTPIMDVLVRLYGGELFEREASIHEAKIADILQISKREVMSQLGKLNNSGILTYSTKDNLPSIRFSVPVRKKNPLLNTTYLKIRKELYQHKIDAIINYARHDKRCRTQLILEYFDEQTDELCGVCDNCLKEKKQLKQMDRLDQIEKKLLELLQSGSMKPKVLQEHFGQNELLPDAIRNLLDIGKIQFEGGEYQLQGQK